MPANSLKHRCLPMFTAAVFALPLSISETSYRLPCAFIGGFNPLVNLQLRPHQLLFGSQAGRSSRPQTGRISPWRRSISTQCTASQRTIIVGDVHGCRQELEDLLTATKFDVQKDQLMFVGDLVAKGPDSLGCLRLALDCNARVTRGNHEAKVLRDGKLNLGGEHVRIYRELRKSPELMKFVEEMPLFLRLDEVHCGASDSILIVHAGLVPHTRPEDNKAVDLMHMRNVIWSPDGFQPSAQDKLGEAWAKRWSGPEFVVFGHDAKRGLQVEEHAIGIDTGCVYGGKLTALVLPNRELVSVPARDRYAPIIDKSKTGLSREVPA